MSPHKHTLCIFNHLHVHVHVCQTFIDSSPRSTLSKNVSATDSRASLGHSVNQSMVQQLTSDGNIRHLERNESPTGLIHNTMCNLFWTWLMKYENIPSLK